MKYPLAFLLLSLSIFSIAAPAQDQKTAAPAFTLASVVNGQIDNVEKQLLAAAEAMPEEKYNFSPDNLNIPGSRFKDVRSFALQLKHVAASNYAIWSALTSEQFPKDFYGGDGPAAIKTKAEIIQFLKDSFALGRRAAATLTPENMLQNAGKSKAARIDFATFAVAHAFDHYGQIVEYLRINGLAPASR